MPSDAEIDLQKLLVDERNPRLPDGTATQRDALLRLVEHQGGAKLLSLCRHIAEHGLNPAQRFIVIPEGGDYVVLDGNRRLTAIKALDTPSAFPSLTAGQVTRLKNIAKSAVTPRVIGCVVFRDRIEAEPWVRLTHLNQRGGVGQSKWSSLQKARHEERLGNKPPELQIVDFVQRLGALSPQTKELIDGPNFPMSLIERMLETKEAKPLLGIDIKAGVVSTTYPQDQVLRGLSKFIDDIGTGAVDSRKLNTSKERVAYLRGLAKEELPDPSTRGDQYLPLEEARADSGPAKPTRKRRDRASSMARPYLIPADVHLQIPPNRLHDIYLELKGKVRVDDIPNAAGGLLRVFLEMSLEAYCRGNRLRPRTDHLRDLLTAATDHLVANQVLTKKQASAVRSAIIDSSTGLTTVQAIVHNPDYPVTGNELKSVWSRVQPLFAAIWL